eukprot:3938442-Rhodomonas_salina.3
MPLFVFGSAPLQHLLRARYALSGPAIAYLSCSSLAALRQRCAMSGTATAYAATSLYLPTHSLRNVRN